MSKASSYYDWELSFKRKTKSDFGPVHEDEEINSLGISDNAFKDFLKKWKEHNIS